MNPSSKFVLDRQIVVDALKDRRLKEILTTLDKVSQIIRKPKYENKLLQPTPQSIVSFFNKAADEGLALSLFLNLPFMLHSEIYLQIISDAKKELSQEYYKEAIDRIPLIDSYDNLLKVLDLLRKSSLYGCEMANVRINDAIETLKSSFYKVSIIYKRTSSNNLSP